MSCSPSAPAVFGYSLPSIPNTRELGLGFLSGSDERHPPRSEERVGSLRVDVERREHEELGDDQPPRGAPRPSGDRASAREDDGGDGEHGEEGGPTPDRRRSPRRARDRRPAIAVRTKTTNSTNAARGASGTAEAGDRDPQHLNADSRQHCERERDDGRREHRKDDKLEDRQAGRPNRSTRKS